MNFELHRSADLRTFVVKMSRVEFTCFFKTITLILLIFLLKKCSYIARIFKKISLYEEFVTLRWTYAP